MAQYTVIWRGHDDDYMVTLVELGDAVDARQMDTNEWADLAYAAECDHSDWSAEEAAEYLPSRDGYDLISVIRGELDFIY